MSYAFLGIFHRNLAGYGQRAGCCFVRSGSKRGIVFSFSLLLIHAAEGVSRSRGTWQQAQPANNPHRSDTQITAEEGREIAKCVAVDWNDLCSASVHKSLGVAW